jgi:hypothetical protein
VRQTNEFGLGPQYDLLHLPCGGTYPAGDDCNSD